MAPNRSLRALNSRPCPTCGAGIGERCALGRFRPYCYARWLQYRNPDLDQKLNATLQRPIRSPYFTQTCNDHRCKECSGHKKSNHGIIEACACPCHKKKNHLLLDKLFPKM